MQNDHTSSKIHRVGKQLEQGASAEQPVKQAGAKAGGARKRHKKKMSKTARIVLLVVVALLATGGVMLLKFYHDISNPQSLFQQESVTPTPKPTVGATAAPGAVTTPMPSPTPDPEAQLLSQADLEFMQNRVNILVLGIDESTERANWGSFRTDTMILASIDFETHDVDLISIPRDSYVKICNSDANPIKSGEQYKFEKVNSAFSAGGGAQKSGYQYAMGTVEYLFGGIPVEHYIAFNMNVVKEVVNAMGGVDYDVDIQVTMNGRTLQPGMQHLDGQAVLDYARQRKGSSDIERVDRQQRILFAIFRQLKSTGQIGNIPQIYQAVQQNIDTDLDFKEISALALIALRMDENQLSRHTVEGEFLNMDSTSYWGIRTNRLKSLINDVFGISASVDDEINAADVRKLYEESQVLLTDDASANEALSTAGYILTTFETVFQEKDVNNMKSAVNLLKNALQTGDEAMIEQYTQKLNSLNAKYLDALEKNGYDIGQDAAKQPESSVPEAEEEPVG